MSKATKINNEFEAKIKITNFSSKEAILNKINSYCNNNKTGEEEQSSYDIEKETSNMILLNFRKATELANYINSKLKLLQIENPNFSGLNCNLIIKIKNTNKEKGKIEKDNNENQENQENKEGQKKKTKNKNLDNEIFNIDAKNNQTLNKNLGKSLNFNKKNLNKYINPENSKLKIYESIFLGGPYINKYELVKEENRKNKEKWLNKKGFVPYISHQTLLKNSHMIDNYLYKEKMQDNKISFRSVEKNKWIGKHDFNAYS